MSDADDIKHENEASVLKEKRWEFVKLASPIAGKLFAERIGVYEDIFNQQTIDKCAREAKEIVLACGRAFDEA